MKAARARLEVSPQMRPALAGFVQLRFDTTRQCHVLLSPERVGMPDDVAIAVLSRCDGQRTVAEIAADLARQYAAPIEHVETDVIALLQPLADDRLLGDGADGHAIAAITGEGAQAHQPRPGTEVATSGVPRPRGLVPVGLLMELTHRCPLQCVYCSNPVDLERRSRELSTDAWRRVLDEAAALGVLQVHLSGGEPTARPDLEDLVAHASRLGLYTNLITAGIGLTPQRLAALKASGLAHVQLSLQAADEATSSAINGRRDALAEKRATAHAVRDLSMALTINTPVHRMNLDRLDEMIAWAEDVDAHRIEVAHVQYAGWAARNRTHLLPTVAQVHDSVALVETARDRLRGRLAIDFVAPDQHAAYPKACMGGWGRNFINVTPSGTVLPCHAALTISHLAFEHVSERSLDWIWFESPSFNAFRGTDWMQSPCATCDRRTRDWGGCRCQAFAETGDAAATDPACHLSPHHTAFRARVAADNAPPPAEELLYRRVGQYVAAG